jgi:hypothetical protein
MLTHLDGIAVAGIVDVQPHLQPQLAPERRKVFINLL